MAIYQRGKSYYYDFVHKGQRYAGCIGPVSRTVAKEEEARKKAEVIEGRLNPAKARKTPRFDAFAVEYLEWVKTNKKPLTYQRFASILAHCTAVFGQQKLSALTAWQIEQYKKARKDAGRQPSTINVELAVLKAMLRKAQQWGKLADLPTKDVKFFKGVQGKTRFLSEEEETEILTVCSPALRRVVAVGLLTGFRRQELVTLRPEDIEFTRGTVTVAACYAKNGQSRTLPIGSRLRAILMDAVAAAGAATVALTTGYGNPWTPKGLTQAFNKASCRAGLERLGPHVLRHTFASRLVMAGVDLRTVQELLGHKNITMTLRYAHLSPDHTRQAMDALERTFSAKSPINSHNTPPGAPAPAREKVVAIR